MSNIYDDVERDDLLLNHICWVLVVTYFKKQKNCGDEWWEPGVWRSQRDLPCYPLLPFVHGVGLGEVCPAHSVFSLSLLDRDPRNVCNAWKKIIPFSQEILLMYFYELCNKMQVNVLGVFMKSCVTLLCSMPCWWTMILAGCLVLTATWSRASLVLPAYDT